MPSHETLDRATELIDQQLRPNVVRIDTEEFYPEAFLRRLTAIGGFKHHALAAENMPLAINIMSQAGLLWINGSLPWVSNMASALFSPVFFAATLLLPLRVSTR